MQLWGVKPLKCVCVCVVFKGMCVIKKVKKGSKKSQTSQTSRRKQCRLRGSGPCGARVFSPPGRDAKLSTALRRGFRNSLEGREQQQVEEVDH